MSEPSGMEEAQALFDSLRSLDSFETKGPLVKLMRWFSWFESMTFLEGELWLTKMVLESSTGQKGDESEQEVDERPKGHKDAQEELRELKRRKGTWKLAPQLINQKNMAVKDIIMSIGKSSWKLFAGRARDIFTPNHVLEFNISCSYLQFWKQELVDIVNTSLYDERHIQHLLPEFQCHDQVLEWHTDLFDKFLQARSQSLAVFHCLPPNLYNHSLAPSPLVAQAASDLALGHWQKLLEAEEAAAEGVDVKPLKSMHWRLNPLLRTLLMAYEEDDVKKKLFTIDSSALKLQGVIGKTLGDSRLVENIHQHGRDLFRASKNKTIGNTSIMANALRSGVLEGRKVPMVGASATEKALSSWGKEQREGVVQSMRSKGRKMPLVVQKMMVAQRGDHTWPSPSPGALFQSAMATHWLFYFWGNDDQRLKAVDVNAAWVSFLARPGSILAQRSAGLMVKVLASAEFGFVGLRMKVELSREGQRFYCCGKSRADINFHYIWDLDDWIEVEVEPCMPGIHLGPIGWEAAGSPLPLLVSALTHGHTMTMQQVLGLLKLFGGSSGLGASPSKKAAMEMLIGRVVPDDLVDLALSHIQEADAKESKEEKMFDSDFSEVLSELGQDENNLQDLKELKEKKKFYKMKRKMKARDSAIPKAKAKAKAKGKAKAKAKAKPKAKVGLGAQWVRRTQNRLAASREAGANMPHPDASMPPEAPPPEAPAPAPAEAHPPPPPPAEIPAPMEVDQVVAAVPGEGQAPAPRAERRRSPEEIMSALEPPGCRFGISFQDHRFVSTWKKDHPGLPGALSQKSFTRAFVTQRSWREALIQVHEHNWKKWQHLKKEYPLPPEKMEMRPGQIPDPIFQQLEATITTLEPQPTRYYRRTV